MLKTNTIIIGAGHSGLAISYYLTKKKIPHIILEKGEIGEFWKSSTWDSLRMVLPNWMTQLPGFHYKGDEPNGFDSKQEYIKYLEDYAKSFKAPIKTTTSVISLTKQKDGFLVKTNKGLFLSKNVVVATGGLQVIKLPNFAKKLPKDITQLLSTEYKNPNQIKKGSVLIVGSGNSGVQIADDLQNSGYKTYLSVSKSRHIPRRYKGKDAIHWLQLLGKLDVKVEDLPNKESQKITPLLMTGSAGGYSLNLHNLAKNGATLIGRIEDISLNKIKIKPDLEENLEFADNFYDSFTQMVDDYMKANHLNSPNLKGTKPKKSKNKKINQLDLKKENIKTIIWATGFINDFSWIKLDIFDKDGEPIHTKGLSKVPGLYFIGLKWLSKYKSNFIYGVGEDAKYITENIKS